MESYEANEITLSYRRSISRCRFSIYNFTNLWNMAVIQSFKYLPASLFMQSDLSRSLLKYSLTLLGFRESWILSRYTNTAGVSP
jgi:hypothetical protein